MMLQSASGNFRPTKFIHDCNRVMSLGDDICRGSRVLTTHVDNMQVELVCLVSLLEEKKSFWEMAWDWLRDFFKAILQLIVNMKDLYSWAADSYEEVERELDLLIMGDRAHMELPKYVSDGRTTDPLRYFNARNFLYSNSTGVTVASTVAGVVGAAEGKQPNIHIAFRNTYFALYYQP